MARRRPSAGCRSCAPPRGRAGAAAGELAFLLEPDLKEARGGLRDVHALHALAAAQLLDLPRRRRRRRATSVLLDIRGELHRRDRARRWTGWCCRSRTRSPRPRLGPTTDDLLRAVADAGRTIALRRRHRLAAGRAELAPAAGRR